MEKFATENLILLEFLVDQINMDYDIQKEVSSIMGETCVSFQFLDNAPLHICEQDFTNKQQLGADQNVKSGKSCLFSLTPQQAQTCSKTFDIVVEIFKKMAKGVLPDQIPIGKSLISIVNLFNELVASITTSGETPAAKTLKDCFKITNTKGDDVGHISVYIRMSCFGKLIVTQFQMNLEDKSVQFKAKEGHYLFKYNKGKAGAQAGKSNPCEEWQKRMQPLNPTCPETSCMDALMQLQQSQGQQGPQQQLMPQQCPQQQQMPQPCPQQQLMPQQYGQQSSLLLQQQQQMKPEGVCPVRPDCPGDRKSKPSLPEDQSCPLQPCLFRPASPQRTTRPQLGYPQPFPQNGLPGAYPPQSGPPCSFPPQQMQQSGPPCAFPPQQMQQSGPSCPMPNMQMPQMLQLPGGPQGGFPFPQGVPQMSPYPMPMDSYGAPCLECDQPQPPDDPKAAYQEIGATMGGNAITIRVHKDKAQVEEVTDSDFTESDTSCVCEHSYSKKKQKKYSTSKHAPCTPRMTQQLAMKPGLPDSPTPFSFKMAGCGQASKNNVYVNPPTSTAKDGTVYTELSDPNRDVFVLRIGKKSEGVDKKNNLELELCTPKGPELKPTPKKETRDTQYDEKDYPKGDEKGGKGKKGAAKGKKNKTGTGTKGSGKEPKSGKGTGDTENDEEDGPTGDETTGKGKKSGGKGKKGGSTAKPSMKAGRDGQDDGEDHSRGDETAGKGKKNGGKGGNGKNDGKGKSDGKGGTNQGIHGRSGSGVKVGGGEFDCWANFIQ